MKILNAELNKSVLSLTLESSSDAMKWLYSGFIAGNDYDIVKHIEKRSRNANAYAWTLISKISSKIGIPAELVYKQAVRNAGCKSTAVTIRKDAVREFQRVFVSGHIGRGIEIIGETEDSYDLLITYGSSDYNTEEMSRLIDSLVEDAHELGIETLESQKIDSLIEEWENGHQRL